jgi:hypothetical protein
MNKVYFFIDESGDHGGIYVAARTLKEGKKFALSSDILDLMMLWNPYIELNGHMERKEGKPIFTEYEGELNIKQINELGLAWWDCDECGAGNFSIINEFEYKCNECGYSSKVPYAGV